MQSEVMYASRDFTSKAAFKRALADGQQITVRANYFGDTVPEEGTVAVAGPWYPEPHRWYATVTLEAGVVVKVK